MNADLRIVRKRETGQTLIIAMIVLGVLLVIGIVFIALIGHNIRGTQTSQARASANDLAEAGIRYAHGQLLHSEEGADWRGTPTNVALVATTTTIDPDAYYLRPASFLPLKNGASQVDLGGPDGLGPFIRVNFQNGRALVRVSYGPSDANVFSSSPVGPLRNPGAARSYLIIESIGREGAVKTNDPTTMARTAPVQIKGFNSTDELTQAMNDLKRYDSQYPNSRHLLALDSIGIIESARFITNKDNVSRPAEIGIPSQIGVWYGNGILANDSKSVDQFLTMEIGNQVATSNISSTLTVPGGFGSLYSNAPLLFHGSVDFALNPQLGDGIQVAGPISAATGAQVSFTTFPPTGASSGTKGVVSSLNSRDPLFSTVGGLLRDGMDRTDVSGFPRNVARKEAPSILVVDPETKQSRYMLMTRESGVMVGSKNSGWFGHGRGVYVDNYGDRQIPIGEDSRANVGATQSQVNDWLTPGFADQSGKSFWSGGFYTPPGAYVQLRSDGFIVTRDGYQGSTAKAEKAEQEGTWRDASGNDSGKISLQYRIGWVPGPNAGPGKFYIVNGLTPGVDITGSHDSIDFTKGMPFNGVLYFEGNVRVRGVIPTDVPLMLVSNATIYIEGSILKGLVGNDVTASYNADQSMQGWAIPYGSRLTRPSRSALMLAASDYVTVNTTQFFGVTPGTNTANSINNQTGTAAYDALRMTAQSGSSVPTVTLQAELPLDPTSGTDANKPNTWTSYVMNYTEAGTSNKLGTRLLVTHTMDDGGGAASFISLDVNAGIPGIDSKYGFPFDDNTAMQYVTVPSTQTNYPVYGLGSEPWQRYNRFETRGFVLVDPTATSFYASDPSNLTLRVTGDNANSTPGYLLHLASGNEFTISAASIGGASTNQYLLAHTALTPGDIRIEASIFAENGSFFVIPGQWFNQNPNDLRSTYEQKIHPTSGTGAISVALADLDRKKDYGAWPETPFFGEPLDVRVVIYGAVSENMPPPIGVQAEWLKKWGWIPPYEGSLSHNDGSPVSIPNSHTVGSDKTVVMPNLLIQYDPMLATARIDGFSTTSDPGTLVRTDELGRALPPIPRLPVSPKLTYFGEVQ